MKRILIIEGESLVAELLKKKLAEQGYYVFLARDGEAGLKEIRAQKPDLILLDIVLPRLNGFEMLKRMNKEEGFENIPVIILSNSGRSEEIREAKEMGVAGWLVKTEFDVEQMLEKVDNALGGEN